MALIFPDRVMNESTSVGTGDMVVAGVVQGWKPFAQACAIGDTFYYIIINRVTGIWETGLGTYSAANTLTRTTVSQSTNPGNTRVDFGAGTKNVFIDVIGTYFANMGAGAPVDWSAITGKPSTFPPAPHTHQAADLPAPPADAPNDGKMYARKDGQWVEVVPGVPEAPNNSTYYTRYNGQWRVIPISGDTDEYDFSAQLVTPPGPGQVRFNAALGSATKCWLHMKTALNTDITYRLRSLAPGGVPLPDITMYFQDKGDHNRHYDYRVTAFNDLIDSVNYVELTLEMVNKGTLIISGGQRCIVVFR